jgi:hypothetical protein
MKPRHLLIPALLALLVSACAIRLGGPRPLSYTTLALAAPAGLSAADAAQRVRQAGARLALVSAHADSAWVAELAAAAGLRHTRPGSLDGVTLAFLGPEAVGDTTLVLDVEGGGAIAVHDALYRLPNQRFLDLMVVRIAAGTPPRDAARVLLGYIATDVMQQAAVILAVDVAEPAMADSLAAMLRPAFFDARRCAMGEPEAPGLPDPATLPAPALHLFYGPEVRIRCEEAELLPGPPASLVARLVVRR